MSPEQYTPEGEQSEEKRGEKLWTEFNRWESARRLFPFAIGTMLLIAAISVFIIEYTDGN